MKTDSLRKVKNIGYHGRSRKALPFGDQIKIDCLSSRRSFARSNASCRVEEAVKAAVVEVVVVARAAVKAAAPKVGAGVVAVAVAKAAVRVAVAATIVAQATPAVGNSSTKS